MADTDLEPVALGEPPEGAPAGAPPIDGEPPLGGDAPRGRPSRAWIAGALVVALVGGVVGFRLATGGKSAVSATTVQNGSAPAAAAGGGRRFGGGLVGTLASVSGDTLIVTTASGVKTTVHTSSATTFTQTVDGSINDVKVGDHVLAMGASAGTNHITAQRITDSGTEAATFGTQRQGAPPGAVPPAGTGNGNVPNRTRTRPPGSFAAGTVKSISGSTLVVTGTDGTTLTTVDTTSSTTVSVVKTISVQALTTGETVRVQGTTAADGSVTATAVREGAGGFGAGGFGPGGPPPGAGTTGSGAGA
jgi:hypothetical protein